VDTDTGTVPLPCHGVQPTYTCAWCSLGFPRHTPTPAELQAVASIYGGTVEMRWAVELGVHPSTGEMQRLLDARGW
jgi:hypothetical protein